MTAPPELVAATEQPLSLDGTVLAVLTGGTDSGFLLDQVVRGESTATVTVEELRAERNPGLVYDLFFNRPDWVSGSDADFYYVGTFTFFGIESVNDPDHAHDGSTGMRHTFDATHVVRGLAEAGQWDSASLSVTVEPVPRAGEEVPSTDVAAQVGRIGLFVGTARPPSDGSIPIV